MAMSVNQGLREGGRYLGDFDQAQDRTITNVLTAAHEARRRRRYANALLPPTIN